ncbi:MAG: ATP-binding protein [Bryobacteraceae bacterium]
MKEFPPFRLDTVNQCLWRCGEAQEQERILLTPKAFAVLQYLLEHAGRLVTQDELLEAVWPDTFVQPEVLKYQIADIRSVLGDRPRNPLFIETLPRRGYQFIAAVRESEPAEPSPSARASPARLVGRDGALGKLRNWLCGTLKGQSQIVFITGEPGIGKTALVDEFQRLAVAAEPSLRIARGQCVEGYGGAEAYYPMLQAVGQLCRGPQGNRVVDILAAQAPTWLVQFPALLKRGHRQALQQEILGATRDRMLREIREALETITAEAPLLLVFEDLQWVDSSTVDLISALARQRTTAKTMLVITKRPVDLVAPDHPLRKLKHDLLVHHLCQEIILAPLTESEVAEYLASESPGGSLPRGFAELIHRHSEGNPLFMVAFLDHMTAHGLIWPENGSWLLQVPIEEIDLEVPETLRQMIEAQIDHLTAEEQRALEAASVAGGLCSPSVIAAAMKMDIELLEELFARLSRQSHVLRAAGARQLSDGRNLQSFEFLHALYREVLYLRLTPARRASLHRRIGEALEELFSSHHDEIAAELADHFEHASDWPRGVKYLRLAAETAVRRFAPREAAATLRHALELAGRLQDTERAENETGILEYLAGIYVASGDIRAAESYADLVARADGYGLIDVEVRALADWAFIAAWDSLERGLEPLERALHLVRTLDPTKHLPTHATCLFWRLWFCGWNAQHAEEYRIAIGEVRKLEISPIVGQHLLDYSCIQWCSSEYRDSHRNAVDGLKMLFESDSTNPFLSIRYMLGEHVLGWNLIFLGEWGRALRAIDDAITMANRNGDYSFRVRPAQLCRAWVHLNACDFAGVLSICDSAIPLVRDPTLRAAPDPPAPFPHPYRLSLILRGSAEAALGNYERAREYLFAARDEMDRQRTLNEWYWRILLESGLTELWLAERDLTLARPQAERFLSLTLTTAQRTWQALAWEANSRVAQAELDVPRAQDCIDQALSIMEGYELPLAEWRVHATAFELYQDSRDRDLAERHQAHSRGTIVKLANSLAPDDPLRDTFLTATRVSKILKDAGESTEAAASTG